MNLHIPTMFVMVLIVSAVMATTMLVVAHRRATELRIWSFGLALQVVAYVLLTLRGHISDVLSIVVANGLISLSLSLHAWGICRFHDKPYPRWLLWVPLVLTLLGYSYWIDNYHGRTQWASSIWLLQSSHIVALIWVHRRHTVGRGQYILASAGAVFGVAMLYRLITAGLGLDSASQMTDVTPLTILNYVSSTMSTLLLAVGALTMTQERSEHERSESEARYRKLVDAADEGICVLQDGHFRFVNPKTVELLGHSEAELVDHPFLPLIDPIDREAVQTNHAKRLQGEADDLRYPARMITPHHGVRWFEISGVKIDWHGRPATLNFLTDVTERRASEEQIRQLAFHDTLTHLPNRRLLMEHLRLARSAYARNRKHGALLFLDLDNFKPLNDQHGHAVGDLLLIEVAQRLLRHIRGADTAARFGGDEFVVLLTQLSEDAPTARSQAEQLTEKLLAILGQPYWLSVERDGQTETIEHRCTATIGGIVFNGTGAEDDALLSRADAAMYQAKQAGRNRVQFDTNSP